MSATSSFQLADWQCPDEKCRNVNFGKRTACNRCGCPRPREHLVNSTRKIGHEIGKQAAEKSNGLFSADDWQCGKCGNVNWARRNSCNMCNAPKVGEVERRTGLGGGYNERDGVEYKQRHEESDGEYDDFGRRKKRRKPKDVDETERDEGSGSKDSDESRRRQARSRSRSPVHRRRDQDRGDEDDEDDAEDFQKKPDRAKKDYKAQDNGDEEDRDAEDDDADEEDEEDDDDDADLSKYDLLA